MEYDEMINQKKVSIWNTRTVGIHRFLLDRVRINYNFFRNLENMENSELKKKAKFNRITNLFVAKKN